MERQQLRERYQQLDWPQQLGNLASTLARVSSRAPASQYDALVGDLLRDAVHRMERPHVLANLLTDLAAMQRELLAWQRVWPLDQARPLLDLYTRHTSDRLLRVAGLVPQP